jgi:hypothetical protein
MKKISLALFALAAALAITPAVMADSFEYTINGTNFNAALNLVTGPANIANGATQAGAYTILDVSGTFSVNGGPAITFGPTAPEVANTGSNATNLTLSSDGGFLFDNLLYPESKGNGILDWGGLLVEFGGYELNVFSGSFGSGAPNNEYFYFADNGSNHSNILIPINNGDPAQATLVATPEPGSLLMLGTGVFGLALISFRKAAKRSFCPVLNA